MRKVIVSMAKECRSDADVTMASEIREAPAAVSRQLQGLTGPLAELVGRLKRRPPQVVVTCARGSSAHAATFGKHLIERYIGIPVAEALVATAAGLFIAIVALLAFNYFSQRLAQVMDELEQLGTRLVDTLRLEEREAAP